MRHIPPILLILFADLLMSGEASAATCPTPYNGGWDLCGAPVSGLWTCDLTNGGFTDAGTAYIIRGYATSVYTAFGVDGAGNYFCSEYATSSITSIELYGTAFDDTLQFQWSTYNLDAPSGQLLAEMFGMNTGDSIMEGSRSTSTNFLEKLHGGQGDDIINGNAGIDEIYGDGDDDYVDGGDGNDTIDGGTGADEINGGADNDTIHGGVGNDLIRGQDGEDSVWGDEGDDSISGGGGSDTLRGGDEIDYICGDDNADTLTGGTGNDILYGGNATDSEAGNAGTDKCESLIDFSCENLQVARPASCPTVDP